MFKPSWHCISIHPVVLGQSEAGPLGVNNDILDDPLLSSPPISQGESMGPQSPEAFTLISED